jgi:hypothetical protein
VNLPQQQQQVLQGSCLAAALQTQKQVARLQVGLWQLAEQHPYGRPPLLLP